MRLSPRPLVLAALLAALLGSVPGRAGATDLLAAWQAAQTHERELAVARAAHAAADPQRRQAVALWRPGVSMTAAAGLGYGESAMRNAQFTAPGMGSSNGVAFGTSVTSGAATRIALQASQPLFNPERRAQQAQLQLQADMGDLQWRAAEQAAMLRTSERYLALALAQEQLQLIERQLEAVGRSAAEAQDRFDIGAAPITAVHEARAQQAQLQARRLAQQSDLDVKRRALADATGLPMAGLAARLPAAAIAQTPLEELAQWQERSTRASLALALQQSAVDMARLEAQKYRAAMAPKLDLVAQAEQQRLSGRGDYGSGALNRQTHALLGVQLTVPLSTGGWHSAKEAEALAQWSAAQAGLDAAREALSRQVHATWLGLNTGRAQVEALQEALTASRARQDATRTGYEVGQRTLLDLLHAENEQAATELALAQARSQLLLARLQLAQLGGTLDETALAQANASLTPIKP